jgi:hypothetical protein
MASSRGGGGASLMMMVRCCANEASGTLAKEAAMRLARRIFLNMRVSNEMVELQNESHLPNGKRRRGLTAPM